MFGTVSFCCFLVFHGVAVSYFTEVRPLLRSLRLFAAVVGILKEERHASPVF